MVTQILRGTLPSAVTGLLPARVKALIKGYLNPPVYPRSLQVEPTRRCNLKCVMCPRTQFGEESKPDMNLAEFTRIVAQFSGLEWVTIQGLGEPLLNRDFLDMIEYVRSRGIKTWFFTNLHVLTESQAERLVACSHNEIFVSIESTNPEQFEDVRRGGSLERVLKNLEKLHAAKRRAGSDLPKVSVHAILMKHLLSQVPEMVATLRDYGVSELHFTELNTYDAREATLKDGTRLKDMVLRATMSDDESWRALRAIEALGNEQMKVFVPGNSIGMHLHQPQRVGVVTCRELWEMPYVTVDGYVTPCCYGSHPSIFNMGNFSEQSFEEIWFGKPYQRLRWQHVTNRHPEHCRKCHQLFLTFAMPSRLFHRAALEHDYGGCFVGRNPKRRNGACPAPQETEQGA
jgi:radical SAM protein with 4Fe4S-binding SPASM domain